MSTNKVWGAIVVGFCLLMFYGGVLLFTAAARGEAQYHRAMEHAMEAK